MVSSMRSIWWSQCVVTTFGTTSFYRCAVMVHLPSKATCFFHDWPTDNHTASTKALGTCACADASWPALFLQGWDGVELMESECNVCRQARGERARAIPLGSETTLEERVLTRVMEDVKKSPFVEAPPIYAYNVPKWSTVLVRAREYAKQTGQMLCWAFAHDVPFF